MSCNLVFLEKINFKVLPIKFFFLIFFCLHYCHSSKPSRKDFIFVTICDLIEPHTIWSAVLSSFKKCILQPLHPGAPHSNLQNSKFFANVEQYFSNRSTTISSAPKKKKVNKRLFSSKKTWSFGNTFLFQLRLKLKDYLFTKKTWEKCKNRLKIHQFDCLSSPTAISGEKLPLTDQKNHHHIVWDSE